MAIEWSVFDPEDFTHVADLMESAIDQINEGSKTSKDLEGLGNARLRALLSNNVNIIIAALRIAGDKTDG
jgi:hypothetical protein